MLKVVGVEVGGAIPGRSAGTGSGRVWVEDMVYLNEGAEQAVSSF